MKWNADYAMSAVFAVALAAALAGQAHASCGSSQRIAYTNADCLGAYWENKSFPIKGKAGAWSMCSALGKVVVKVDRKSGSDWTWHLNDGEMRENSGGYFIQGISCCRDLSDLCNKSEINADSCLDRFEDSRVDESCTDLYAGVNSIHQCVIRARCPDSNGDQNWQIVAVDWRDASKLTYCNGTLQVDGC